MIKKKTAIDYWLEFVEENGREPDVDEFVNMGYYKTYFYTIRKKARQIKEEELRQTIQIISNQDIDAIFAK